MTLPLDQTSVEVNGLRIEPDALRTLLPIENAIDYLRATWLPFAESVRESWEAADAAA